MVAVAEASQGKVIFGYYTSVLLLADRNLPALEEAAQDIRKVILNLGFQARIETVNAVDAYLGTMPGNTVANVRRPVVHTLNLAHLMPFTSVWAGPDHNPCPFYPRQKDGSPPPPLLWTRTSGATPFRLSLHSGDLGHAAVLGPTGSGKSTLLATAVAQHFRYARAQVFCFDKGYSMLPLVWAAGGEHYDISGGADGVGGPTVAFAPLARCDEESEQRWAAEWLESCVELQGVRVTPEQRQEIYRAVKQLGDFKDAKLRTLGQFRATIQDTDLRTAIEPYTVRGVAGDLLDATEDGMSQDRFQVLRNGTPPVRGDRVVLPVLTYLFTGSSSALRPADLARAR
ncbi:conjugal transfer protein TrbE, partial [mine drainage metagenome]